jgi:hypothetical protein
MHKLTLFLLLLTLPTLGLAQTPVKPTAPTICQQPLSASNMPGVAAFIWAGCPQALAWPQDQAPRMSGPVPGNTHRSVHGFVFNFYSPNVYAWLKAGRPMTELADGSIIIKQMFADNKGKPGAVSGWAIMVKQKSASLDGWFWGYVDPQQSKGGDGAFGGQFYDPNCVACHGSAVDKELTFASLSNIAPYFPEIFSKPEANDAKGGSQHSKIGLLGNLKAAVNPVGPIWSPIPSQAQSKVIVGPHGPNGFVSSDVCAGCHDASNLAFSTQAHMTAPQNLPPSKYKTTPLTNFSPYGEWGASLMGLAARDPVFQAQRESETRLYPEVAAEIDNACYTCHGVMGKRQLNEDKPGELYTHAHFMATSGEFAKVGALGRDGISCATCHRITPEGLGTPASFTGEFKVGDPKTIFGPYQDVVTYPMQNSVGMTPKHGSAITDPAMCGSCHVVETPILDAKQKYDRASFGKAKKSHEQTTYLEWLNSAFQTKAPPGNNPTPKTCQACHMPDQLHGQKLASKIANIEDNTYLDASGKPFAATAPLKDITLTTRNPFSRHTFVGANVFVLEMFKQFGSQLGLTTADPNYDTSTFQFVDRLALSTQETVTQVQSSTATVQITSARALPTGLEVAVQVSNLTGHKFPSGVGFRRAFIEFTALDAAGQVVWSSGRSNERGEIVDQRGVVLATEFSKTQWQPHFNLITSDQQVQIYEARTKDTQGLLTTSFLSLADAVKDNRLMPKGWLPTGPYASWTEPVGVPETSNNDYYNGRGRDQLIYRIPAKLTPQVRQVAATLYYQSIPPYYLRDRFEIGGNGPMTSLLKALTQQVNYNKTAAQGWKVRVTGASVRL